MDWQWLWQGLLTNWLAALVVAIGTFLVAYLKAKRPSWANVVLYGLAAFCLLVVSFWAFKSMAVLPKEIPQVTANNVETNIRAWLDHFQLGTKKISDPDSHFSYIVTLRNGTLVTLKHVKNFDNYITLLANLEISPEQKIQLAGLKKEQLNLLIHEVVLELSRTKAEGMILNPLQNVLLERRVPITNNLTEDIFIERLNEVGFVLNAARETIILGLNRYLKDTTTQ
jgi:hypothetical protein